MKGLTLAVAAVTAALILTPFSQVGRSYRGEADINAIVIDLLTHPQRTRELYQENAAESYLSSFSYHWFDKPESLLDRLTLVPIDDALILQYGSCTRGFTGCDLELLRKYRAEVPLPGQNPTSNGAISMRTTSGSSARMTTVQAFSFTPYSDAYHTAGWLGDSVILGGMFFLMFYVCDSGCRQRSEVAMDHHLHHLFLRHAGSEGMLGVTTYTATNTTLALIGAAFISTRVAAISG